MSETSRTSPLMGILGSPAWLPFADSENTASTSPPRRKSRPNGLGSPCNPCRGVAAATGSSGVSAAGCLGNHPGAQALTTSARHRAVIARPAPSGAVRRRAWPASHLRTTALTCPWHPPPSAIVQPNSGLSVLQSPLPGFDSRRRLQM